MIQAPEPKHPSHPLLGQLRLGWANVIKLVTAVIFKWAKYARVFILGRPFQPGGGQEPTSAVRANIRLGWRGLQRTNTLSY
jgi:hypothetical protein